MKPLRLALFGALAALLLAAPQAEAQYRPQPYFSPNGGGAERTAELIRNAEESIDIAMYSISTSGVIFDALRDVDKSQVRVRIILHQGHSNSARMRGKVTALRNIGIHVFSVTRTMHEKFALFDANLRYKRKLINGSANWSTGAQFKYSENAVVYGRHIHMIYAFQQEFNYLMSVARAVTPGAEDHMDEVSLRRPSRYVRRYERAVFSSANHGNGTTVISDEIIDLMWAAEESIIIDVAHFNSRTIADALIEIHEEYPEIDIQVLLDMGEYGDRRSRARDLERAGINVRYKVYSLAFNHPNSQLQHHKTMIVDGTDMITGSYNWSDTAESSNYENIIVIQGVRRNERLLEAFLEEHNRLWDGGRDIKDQMLATLRADDEDDPNYQRYVPIHWDNDYFKHSMALTRREFSPMRRVASDLDLFRGEVELENGRTKRFSKYQVFDRETGEPVMDEDGRNEIPDGEWLEELEADATGLADLVDSSE